MEYKDDLLNVYGLLRKKTAQNLSRTLDVVKRQDAVQEHLDELTKGIAALEDQLRELSSAYGLDTALPRESAMPAVVPADGNENGRTGPGLKVHLDPDFDFESAFRALVEEAEAAGFRNTRPEDLLSDEDMKRAAERSRLLDETFAAETGLRLKDVGVLMIAAAIKIALFHISKYRLTAGDAAAEADAAPAAAKEAPLAVDAMQGVDLSQIEGLGSFSDLLYSGDEFISMLRGQRSKISRILDRDTILAEPVPFSMPDNEYFSRADVLGFDPFLGWLFGAVNFMTNTVTTAQFDSFSVIQGGGTLGVGEKLSTPLHVLFPIVNGIRQYKESLVAAIVREADVLNVSHAPVETVSMLMETAFSEKDQSAEIVSFGQSFVPASGPMMTEIVENSALTAFIDLLTASVCSVMYNPDLDGEPQFYSLRIHKILLISSAFATITNSIPAIAAQDVSSIDFAGLLNTLLSLFHTTQYWIDLKTEYLVSEYKKVVDGLLMEIDRYFTTE